MTSRQPPTLEEAKQVAARAGLPLTEAQLTELLSNLARSRSQAEELRQLISKTDEPAGAFEAASGS